jgi:choice-of-anchor A domain-containing protein
VKGLPVLPVFRSVPALLAGTFLAGFALPAAATPLTAEDILHQFNLVVLGDMTAAHDVEGRAYIGGDLTGSAQFFIKGTPSIIANSAYDELVVGGNVKSGSNIKVDNSGTAAIGGAMQGTLIMNGTGAANIGGNLTGNVTVNGGKLSVGGNVTGGANYNLNNGSDLAVGGNLGKGGNFSSSNEVDVAGNITTNLSVNGATIRYGGNFTGSASNVNGGSVTKTTVAPPPAPSIPSDIGDTVKSFADLLRSMANEDATLDIFNNRAVFTVTDIDNDGLAVLDIASGQAFFDSIGEIAFTGLSNVETLVINIGGVALTEAENFLTGSGFDALSDVASTVIWNFYEATSLTFNTEFWGSVLAPYAAANNKNALNGSIVVGSLKQGGEIHLPVWDGSLPPDDPPTEIPEPSTLLLFGAALGLAARRRR